MNPKIISYCKTLTFLIIGIGLQQKSWAVFKYPGCDDLQDSSFKSTILVNPANSTINEPLKMAFDQDQTGNVDVYWVEKHGAVKRYNGVAKTVDSLGFVMAEDAFESGLTGIALDPNFKSNHWMYLYFCFGDVVTGKKGAGSKNYWFKLSRFTLGANGKLDMASESNMLSIPAYYRESHTGGAMRFDGEGNLYITTGENGAGAEGTANTNDLRGKILRIHPTSDGKYTIPQGNLYPEGMLKTRPEIYVMGARNPYSISLDPIRKAVLWGDVGPDGTGITEEHNITSVPGYFGYPYFAGANKLISGTQIASAPLADTNVNLGLPKHAGLWQLPPAIPAVDAYNQAAAITGPIYRYNGQLNSAVKMPPHFEGIWFVSDFNNSWIEALTLDAAGLNIVAREKVFTKMRFYGPLDFQTGPDGAFYLLNYAGHHSITPNTSLVRVEYRGNCHPGISIGTTPPVTSNSQTLQTNGLRILVNTIGKHRLLVVNLQGQTVKVFYGKGSANYSLASISQTGVCVLHLITEQGIVSTKVFK